MATLKQVGDELRRAAKDKPHTPITRTLFHGAKISVQWNYEPRGRHAGQWAFCIQREGYLKPEQRTAWEKELATFRKHLEIPMDAKVEEFSLGTEGKVKACYGVFYLFEEKV